MNSASSREARRIINDMLAGVAFGLRRGSNVIETTTIVTFVTATATDGVKHEVVK